MNYTVSKNDETKKKIKDLEGQVQSLKKITLSLWITIIGHFLIHIICDLINIFI